MNLFNKKLLAQHIARYDFPKSEELQKLQSHLTKLQSFIKDEDLNRTQEIKVQGLFLLRVFTDVLGYSNQIDNNEEWNLEQHPKTEIDSQVADGGLGIFTKDKNAKQYFAVIELKDAKTSLDKKQSGRIGKLTPVEQAFQYLNKFDGCKWAIVSNFREIRLYSKHRGQGFYEKFDIDVLTEEQEFKRFYFVLNKHNLIDDGQNSIIDELVKNTTDQEENITKKFYEHYRQIRLKLLNHLFEHNSEIGKLAIVEKTQKILDRLIFIMVCEDTSSLLPSQLVKNTYERTFQSFTLSDSDQRVWAEFKGLFHAIDIGNMRVAPPINRYNGGLFKFDELLDSLIIKDDIWVDLIKLTDYDFESDLNVNVLGHIFEQSISDLEEIRNNIYLSLENEGLLLNESGDKIVLEKSKNQLIDKKGARKKMGIFYTPEYITKFIVENTIGKFLEEHPENLASIKILDPACGSGAFLNQAHSFLLNQYKIRDEEKQLELHKQGKATGFFDLSWVENDKSILLNNLYGVDLSPESVEITKLALWLKTAKATEPLQNLDSNIKCGNSLISQSEIAGDRAFDWHREYEEILEQGGFDVIIGNPPYGVSFNEKEKEYLKAFDSLVPDFEIYIYFITKGLQLLKEGGLLSYIFPNTFLSTLYGMNFRKELAVKNHIISIVDLSDDNTFIDASVRTCIVTIQKKTSNGNTDFVKIDAKSQTFLAPINSVAKSLMVSSVGNWMKFSHISEKEESLINVITKSGLTIGKLFQVSQGLIPYDKYRGHDEMTIKNRIWHATSKIDSTYKQELMGKDVEKYSLKWNGINWISYGEWLAAPRESKFFTSPRVLIREITGQNGLLCAYTADEYYNNPSIINIIEQNNYTNLLLTLLGILNSKLISFFHNLTSPKANKGLFPKILINDVRNLPLPERTKLPDNAIVNLTKEIILIQSDLVDDSMRLSEVLSTRFNLKSTIALKQFYKLGWNELVDELEKQRVRLDLSELDKLNKWFTSIRKPLLAQEQKINSLETQIDCLVYDLYRLKTEDIRIIEHQDY